MTIALNGISHRYPAAPEPSLRDVNLSWDQGVLLVTGASGSGKSTLMRLLAGLVPHFHGGRISGHGVVAGLPIPASTPRDLAARVAIGFQDPESQFLYARVEREVAFALENRGVDPARMREMVRETLARSGAGHLARRDVRTLSGGEAQRVALASLLVLRPQLLVLDEPTSQLDSDGVAALLQVCGQLASDGMTIVVAEHRIEPWRKLARSRMELTQGRMSPAAEPAARPRTARTARPGTSRTAWCLEGVTLALGGEAVLRDVDLAGCAGEVVALTGRNGGGKTTLLRAIAGVLPPSRGRAHRIQGRVAYLPQNPSVILHRQTLRAELAATIGRDESTAISAALDEMGLAWAADIYPRDLSGGERQRAAIAAVTVGEPALVLLDEPTRGMDEAARGALARMLERLRAREAAVVMATHDLDLAASAADRVIVVGDGEIREAAA